ncbi:MAG TPA: hypothetical protein VIH57_07490 [Bacteroidales bacterium]
MADFEIYMYFSGDPKEPQTWDVEFSYCFNAVLNQILEIPPKILSNVNVPNVSVVRNNYQLLATRAFILIIGGEGKVGMTLDPVKEFIEQLTPHQQDNILIVRRPQKRITEIPDFLRKYRTFNFYEVSPATQTVFEFDINKKGIPENSFWEKVTDLAYDLKYLIFCDSEKDISETRINTIFLAEVTPDQYKNREQLRRELVHSGYHVLPEIPLPTSLKEFEDEVRNFIERSVLSVHIMGEQYGGSPDTSDYSFQEIQNRLFSDVSKKLQGFKDVQPKIKRIVWIQSLFDPYEEKQVQYIKRLRKDISVSRDSELIQSTIFDLKNIIDQAFALLKAPINELLPQEAGSILMIADDHKDLVCDTIKERFLRASLTLDLLQTATNIQSDLAMIMNELKKYKNILVVNSKGDHGWLYSVLSLIARSKGYQGAVAECLVSLFSPTQMKRIVSFETLAIDSYTYSSNNIHTVLESFISKVKV